MTRTLKINEAFKNLIPPLSDEETAELQESLLQYGCRDAIVIWHDTIIDGHNRYRICTEQGLPFKVEDMTFDFDNENDNSESVCTQEYRQVSAGATGFTAESDYCRKG